MPMRCAIAVSLLAAHAASAQPIVLDGSFDDWADIKPAVVDPADAPDAFVDFGAVAAVCDERFVHLLIDLGREVNPQGLTGTAWIIIDADGRPETGRLTEGLPGADIIVELSPGRGGLGLISTAPQPPGGDAESPALSPYSIGLTFAPTYASRIAEYRIRRGVELPHTAPFFTGEQFSAKLVFRDQSGNAADETDIFTCPLKDAPKRTLLPEQADDPLARPDGALRIASWNAERGSLMTRPQPYMRTLRAIDPDVLLLQEMSDDHSAEDLSTLLNRMLPGEKGRTWRVVYGPGGGRLRCAIAARCPLQVAEALRLLSRPDRPDRQVRVIGAIAETGGKRLLIVSLHLKCCGRKDSAEDETRRLEATLINEAIRKALRDEMIDGVVVAGDFNLVGGRRPLDILLQSADLDGSALAAARPMQLDGLSNATWEDPQLSFVPGRLDYLLFSDARLAAARAFVYDARDLRESWSRQHRVTAEDTVSASDHLPLVVDLTWRD